MEDTIARAIETVLHRDYGRLLGPRTEHDFNDGIRWSIDLTYESADPPVALELTTVQDSRFLGTASYVRKVSERLSKLADQEELGTWEVTVREEGDLTDLQAVVTEVVRRGEEIDVRAYSSDDLRRWQQEGRLEKERALRRRLALAGVDQIRRSPAVTGVAVHTWGSSEGSFQGVGDLDAVVLSNAQKIAATGHEGHLGVGVGRYRISSDPADTLLPPLPDAITRIWLVHLWYMPAIGYHVWSAGAGDSSWTVHPPVGIEHD